VQVDARRVTIPSYGVKPGQSIAIDADSGIAPLATAAGELTGAIAPWLEADIDVLRGRVLRLPQRGEITTPVNEALIVEFYARR
jgi:small subunit ribosomal protein S4